MKVGNRQSAQPMVKVCSVLAVSKVMSEASVETCERISRSG